VLIGAKPGYKGEITQEARDLAERYGIEVLEKDILFRRAAAEEIINRDRHSMLDS